MGEVSKVTSVDNLSIVITHVLAFFILHETLTLKTVLAALLITADTLLVIF